MRAVALVDQGPPSGFVPQLVDNAPVPDAPPHYVRVRVSAAALNPVDGKFSLWSGMMERKGTDAAPFVLGLDGAGVIDALGDGVSPAAWPTGTRVAFHLWLARGDGCFAGFCVAHEQSLVRIPDRVSDEDAAALPCAMYTAYKALVTKLHVRAGRTIVVTAGNGGVGGFAIQLARRCFGAARVIATCSAASAERVVALGATDWIDYRAEADIAAAVRRIVPEGVHYVVDCVGDDSATNLVGALRMDGEMACVAGNPRVDPAAFLKGYSFHDVSLGLCAYAGGDIASLSEIGSACMKLVEAGSVVSMVERRITLDEVPEALATIAAGTNRGKVVVTGGFCN